MHFAVMAQGIKEFMGQILAFFRQGIGHEGLGRFGLMALVMFISGSVRNALLLLILAYLISPLGLPMAAAWLLARVQDLRYAIMEAVG